MGAPTLENGPYIFDVNNLYTESTDAECDRRCFLEIKNHLVGLGGGGIWQVVASSNGTSVKNIGDASPDLWSTTSDLVYANPGTAHSWCIIKNLTTNGQLCLDYRNTSSYYIGIYYSHDGFNADGTITDRPTATESTTIQYHTHLFGCTGSNYRKFVINVMCSADHKTTRVYVHRRDSSSGALGGNIILIECPVNTPAVWSSTVKTVAVYYGSSQSFSTTPKDMSPELSVLDDNRLRPYFETTEPYAAWLSAYMTCESYNHLKGNNADGIFKNNVFQGLHDGYPVSPIGIFRTTSLKGGSLGRLRDIYLAQETHNTLDTYPADASRTWVKWGCLLVPWNGTQPQDAV